METVYLKLDYASSQLKWCIIQFQLNCVDGGCQACTLQMSILHYVMQMSMNAYLETVTSVQSRIPLRLGKYFLSFSVSQLLETSRSGKATRFWSSRFIGYNQIRNTRVAVFFDTLNRYARSFIGNASLSLIRNISSCLLWVKSCLAGGSTAVSTLTMARKVALDTPVFKRTKLEVCTRLKDE